MDKLLQIKPIGTPDLPTLPNKMGNGWLPGAMGSKEFVAKKGHLMELMGKSAGYRRLSDTQYFVWYRDNPDVALPIEEFRKNLMRPPLGNEEGGYQLYDTEEVSNVES